MNEQALFGNDWTGLRALRRLAWGRITSHFFSAPSRISDIQRSGGKYSQTPLVFLLAKRHVDDSIILSVWGHGDSFFLQKGKGKNPGGFSPSWRSSLKGFDWQTLSWELIYVDNNRTSMGSLLLCYRGRKGGRERKKAMLALLQANVEYEAENIWLQKLLQSTPWHSISYVQICCWCI